MKHSIETIKEVLEARVIHNMPYDKIDAEILGEINTKGEKYRSEQHGKTSWFIIDSLAFNITKK